MNSINKIRISRSPQKVKQMKPISHLKQKQKTRQQNYGDQKSSNFNWSNGLALKNLTVFTSGYAHTTEFCMA